EGTNRLLWISESRADNPAQMIFGPWAYRANAAQYFNLIWPIGLAFWLWMQERAGRAASRRLNRIDGPQLVLLPCTIFAAICPMISRSRGGALLSVVLGGVAMVMLLVFSRREISAPVRWATAGAIFLCGIAALIGGWSTVKERLSRPDSSIATGIDMGTNEFTTLIRVRVPDSVTPGWKPLLSLASNSRGSVTPQT